MKLKKIVFDVDGKEVELTEVQAVQLRDEINRILGPPVSVTPSWPWFPAYPTEPCDPWRPYVTWETTSGGFHAKGRE